MHSKKIKCPKRHKLLTDMDFGSKTLGSWPLKWPQVWFAGQAIVCGISCEHSFEVNGHWIKAKGQQMT